MRASPRLRLSLLSLGLLFAACRDEVLVTLTPPLILVNVDQLDFGEVPAGFSVRRTLTIANGGDQILELEDLRIDGAAFAVVQGATRVERSGEVQVALTFAPTQATIYDGDLTIESNASNSGTKVVALRGIGVPPTSCGPCDAPPPRRCLSEVDLVRYAETGVCVMNECEYTATVERCEGGCEEASATCRDAPPPDAGVPEDAGSDPDAGAPFDAGVAPDAGIAPDAGSPDAGVPPDAGFPDSGVTPDAGPACGADAGVTDSGLGAPAQVYVAPGPHAFTVPAGVTEVLIRAWGGGGQGGNQAGATGGGGAFVQARLPVTPSESLSVLVAEGGAHRSALGYGAGASYVRRGAEDLLVAGGGGGGGSDGNSGRSMSGGRGGAGGPTGESGGSGNGAIPPYCTLVTGGAGGSATAGGTGGIAQGSSPNLCTGQSGGRNFGGRATGTFGSCDATPGAEAWQAGGGQANGGGGGGGSGYYGGGGAGFVWTYCGGGGGGGASFVAPAAQGVVQQAGSGPVAGNASQAYGAGSGGERCLQGNGAPPCLCNPGGNGRVELYY